MRAWTYTRRGSPSSVLTLTATHPRPTAIPAEHVLIKVTHCGLNPSMTVLIHLLPNPFSNPRVPEVDFAGVIATPGSNVPSHLAPGTAIFGVLPISPVKILTGDIANGALTEYILVHHTHIAVKPANISLAATAGLGTVGCTALNFLDYSGARAGASVLINGGSGGIGTFLVQLAKYTVGPQGTVVAICSGANAEMVKRLNDEACTGADDVVPYDGLVPAYELLEEKYGKRKFDVVIDTIGVQELYTHSPAYLAEGRPYLNAGYLPYLGRGFSGVVALGRDLVANLLLPTWLGGTPRTYRLLSTDLVPDMLERVRSLVERGAVKGVVDSVWRMEDALKAYERLESRRARGKVVVQVQKE